MRVDSIINTIYSIICLSIFLSDSISTSIHYSTTQIIRGNYMINKILLDQWINKVILNLDCCMSRRLETVILETVNKLETHDLTFHD